MQWLDLIRDAPQEPGVYFVWAGGDVIYVGRTRNTFRVRLIQHHKCREFERHKANNITYVVMSGEDVREIKATEKFYIEKFNPILNAAPPHDPQPRSGRAILKKVLEKSGLSASDFAKSLGISPQNLCDIRSGRRKISTRLWKELQKTRPKAG